MVNWWFETICVAEEGFYLQVWQRRGLCRARLHHQYGPLTIPELHQVIDDVTWGLVELIYQVDPDEVDRLLL